MHNKMKQILTIAFILIIQFAFGQNFSYPKINCQGKNIESFIPSGWTLLDSAKGDLNNDKCKDVALVIQCKDSIFDEDSILTQPRMLLIIFYNKAKKRYDLVEQSESFILTNNEYCVEDPYSSISISNKGVLKVEFSFWNPSESSGNSYKFRYQNNEFVLIGADDTYIQRILGDFEETSYNFLTKKAKITTGNIDVEQRNIVWKTIVLNELKTLKTFEHPFYCEIE